MWKCNKHIIPAKTHVNKRGTVFVMSLRFRWLLLQPNLAIPGCDYMEHAGSWAVVVAGDGGGPILNNFRDLFFF